MGYRSRAAPAAPLPAVAEEFHFGYATARPFGYATARPFGYATARPFGYATARLFGHATRVGRSGRR